MIGGDRSGHVTRLRFVTTVYLPAMRDPYSAAKVHWHGGSSGRWPAGARHRRRLVRGRVHVDGPAVRAARETDRRDARVDEGALEAGLDGVRRRVLSDARGWRWSRRRRRSPYTSAGFPTSRCAERRATTAGSATSSPPTERSSVSPSCASCAPKRVWSMDDFDGPHAADRRLHPRALRARGGRRHHRHHHHAVDVLRRPAGHRLPRRSTA